ncbi:MAG: DUF2127 domain-containing protein [Acidothermales bacterium]|nr:DUF2127 domain-containing protein [Acidothermales bacterium]
MDWNLVACARRHVTYAPDEPELRDSLRIRTAAGDAWRCLRCGGYVVGEPFEHGPAVEAPVPRRGREVRDALILRVLALERALRGLVILGAAYAVWTFKNEKSDLRHAFDQNLPLLQPIAERLGWQLSDSSLVHEVRHLLTISQSTLLIIALVLLAYAAVEAVECAGLMSLRRWGEYFAVVATAAFIPFEIYELAEKQTWLRVLTLVFNVAVVVYIIGTKRLFGARGGARAYEAERASDRIIELHEASDTESRPRAA